MRSVRNLTCMAVLTFGAFQVGTSQQPIPENATISLDNSKPLSPQQKQLAEDTTKLLTLANELKAEIDKSNKDTLSLSVVKKAGEVEKLAHKVREEMMASLAN
jgi:hypothetical protein